MSARQLFKDYRSNMIEIKRLKADTCHRVDTVRGSSAESPYTVHPVKISGIDGAQVTANRIMRERLEAECAYVDAAIAMAPNTQVRLILELFAHEGRKWDDIAAVLTSGGIDSSADSVKQTAYRYFKMLDERQQKKQ